MFIGGIDYGQKSKTNHIRRRAIRNTKDVGTVREDRTKISTKSKGNTFIFTGEHTQRNIRAGRIKLAKLLEVAVTVSKRRHGRVEG